VTTYAIVFKGELRDGFIREAVMAAFKERSNLSEGQIEQVFSGRKVTLKKGLTRDGAKQFARDLRAIGMRIIAATEGGPALSAPPAPGTHSIVFAGLVAIGFDAEAVKLTASHRLKFSERQADALFSGKPVTMKRGLSEDKARHYAGTLRALGMEVVVEPPLPELPQEELAPEVTDASLQQTQFAQPAYNFEETFHSSSTLEMLEESRGEMGMNGVHPSLRTPAAPPVPAPVTSTYTHQHVATVINHDLVNRYADQLNEPDAEIAALRAAHDLPEPPQTIAGASPITPEPPMPSAPVQSPFDPPSDPIPEAPETIMSPLDEPPPAVPSQPPAATRGRATESLMPPDTDPEIQEIQRAAEEKRKWLLAGGFVLLVAAIAVWVLL